MQENIILAQLSDKARQAEEKNKIEATDFLDMYQVHLAKNFIAKNCIDNVVLYGGYEDSERKVAVFYPKDSFDNLDESQILQIVRIELPKEEQGKFTHRNYLGGIIKIGIKREKVGDIIVADDRADIIVKKETANALAQQLSGLNRFQNSKISIKEIKDLRKPEIKLEKIDIIVPSLRLDSIVSDLARTSRSKAVEILAQERVFINGQNETKPSKSVKIGDVITIRGKGRFVIKEIKGNTRSGRSILSIDKYV